MPDSFLPTIFLDCLTDSTARAARALDKTCSLETSSTSLSASVLRSSTCKSDEHAAYHVCFEASDEVLWHRSPSQRCYLPTRRNSQTSSALKRAKSAGAQGQQPAQEGPAPGSGLGGTQTPPRDPQRRSLRHLRRHEGHGAQRQRQQEKSPTALHSCPESL